MKTNEALEKLAAYEKTSFALGHAAGLMYYDGATIAPKGSADIRGSTLGELSRMGYNLTTSKETLEMLETLMADKASLDFITARKVSELFRDYDRVRRIPVDEYVAWQELAAKSDAVWHEAKEKDDFALFEPYLQKMFDTAKRIALYMEPDKKPYDTMLDMFERGLDTEKCEAFFIPLRAKLVPLIQKVTAKADQVDDTPLKQSFPVETQRRFSEFLMDVMELDRNHCLIGETEHPFTINFSKYDVRITTHYHEDMLVSSLYSVIHEGGHALYELHIGNDITFTNIGGGVSMAIHESQSRFYENIIGRSREFCGIIYPWLKKEFAPRLDNVTEDAFYRMINKSTPSLIRTEADELTYSLHVMIRYELEKRMFDGTLTAKQLPAEWNRLYKEYLGVDVPNDRKGVLQDSHWSNGNIGYFPSYAIGSAYSAQYIIEMSKNLNLWEEIKSGRLGKINAWFEDRIWKHGKTYDPGKLFESVCGNFNPDVYISYLEKKFTEVYGL
ncbi:MAG: carboxypeptidase M32 [Eubacteriales bacterium]|nr:carboxypeptidase M32 [Eubacteriales bacterium]